MAPVSGMLPAANVLLFMMAAKPKPAHIPLGARPHAFILNVPEVLLIDTTEAKWLVIFVCKLQTLGTTVIVAGARPTNSATFAKAGVRKFQCLFIASIKDARANLTRG